MILVDTSVWVDHRRHFFRRSWRGRRRVAAPRGQAAELDAVKAEIAALRRELNDLTVR